KPGLACESFWRGLSFIPSLARGLGSNRPDEGVLLVCAVRVRAYAGVWSAEQGTSPTCIWCPLCVRIRGSDGHLTSGRAQGWGRRQGGSHRLPPFLSQVPSPSRRHARGTHPLSWGPWSTLRSARSRG